MNKQKFTVKLNLESFFRVLKRCRYCHVLNRHVTALTSCDVIDERGPSKSSITVISKKRPILLVLMLNVSGSILGWVKIFGATSSQVSIEHDQ